MPHETKLLLRLKFGIRQTIRRLPGTFVGGLAGCSGRQSALDPAAGEAERIATLFWGMAAGAVLVWIGVIALAIYATCTRVPLNEDRLTKVLILGGGALVPTAVLAALLIYGLAMLPPLLARAPAGSLQIAVTGEQWWWRVRYLPPGREPVTLANEIRLPVNEPVEFVLESRDVIHSFWIPALGGKMDMIPGRQTTLTLTPTRLGTFRGVCAEYCGTSHALMAFEVVVMEKDAFATWLEQQRQPASEPVGSLPLRGRERFLANGCSACHTIRGTGAGGTVGPDLTHVGGRLSIGAGVLPNEPEAFHRWIAQTDTLKPAVRMPHFGMLPPEERRAIAAYLDSLQ